MKKIIRLLIIMNLLAPLISTFIYMNAFDHTYHRSIIYKSSNADGLVFDNSLEFENDEFVFKPAYYDSTNNDIVISKIKTDKKVLFMEKSYLINEENKYLKWKNSKFCSDKPLKVNSILPTVYSDKVEELHIGANIDVSHLNFDKSFPNLKKIVFDSSFDISYNVKILNTDIYSFPNDLSFENIKINDFNLTKKDYNYLYGNVIIVREYVKNQSSNTTKKIIQHVVESVFDLDNQSLNDIGYDKKLYSDKNYLHVFDKDTIVNKTYYIDTNGDKIYKYEPLILYI